ncbi:MAG: putative transposase [Verrucomicrobiales bacterium]|jgi:putative transposase
MSIPFQPFSEHKSVRIYRTDLPHWRQDGCTYFITFRLADSIPQSVVDGWKREKKSSLALHDIEMSSGKKWIDDFLRLPAIEQRRFQRIFNRKTNDYLDGCHGNCALKQPQIAKALEISLSYFDTERYELGDYIVMPNHVHLLARPEPGHQLETILQSIKKQSARSINRALGQRGTLWQKHTHDHIVRDEVELAAYQKYIANNPKKAGLSEGDYVYRSANYVTSI